MALLSLAYPLNSRIAWPYPYPSPLNSRIAWPYPYPYPLNSRITWPYPERLIPPDLTSSRPPANFPRRLSLSQLEGRHSHFQTQSPMHPSRGEGLPGKSMVAREARWPSTPPPLSSSSPFSHKSYSLSPSWGEEEESSWNYSPRQSRRLSGSQKGLEVRDPSPWDVWER